MWSDNVVPKRRSSFFGRFSNLDGFETFSMVSCENEIHRFVFRPEKANRFGRRTRESIVLISCSKKNGGLQSSVFFENFAMRVCIGSVGGWIGIGDFDSFDLKNIHPDFLDMMLRKRTFVRVQTHHHTILC